MRQIDRALRGLATSLSFAILAAACGGGGSSNNAADSASSLSISATPSRAIVGHPYTLQPSVSNASGTQSFSATNLPAWLTINASSGLISGTPVAGDVGVDSNIVITVSAGGATASTTALSITVSQPASGNATVSWTIPTENADGTALTDLSGFVLLYGQSPVDLSQQVAITDATTTSYTLQNLPGGTWFFAIVSVNSAGVQSSPTNVASITI
jgi:hypothetical protein